MKECEHSFMKDDVRFCTLSQKKWGVRCDRIPWCLYREVKNDPN